MRKTFLRRMALHIMMLASIFLFSATCNDDEIIDERAEVKNKIKMNMKQIDQRIRILEQHLDNGPQEVSDQLHNWIQQLSTTKIHLRRVLRQVDEKSIPQWPSFKEKVDEMLDDLVKDYDHYTASILI